MRCSALYSVAVWCSALQFAVMCCSVLATPSYASIMKGPSTMACRTTLQHTATRGHLRVRKVAGGIDNVKTLARVHAHRRAPCRILHQWRTQQSLYNFSKIKFLACSCSQLCSEMTSEKFYILHQWRLQQSLRIYVYIYLNIWICIFMQA